MTLYEVVIFLFLFFCSAGNVFLVNLGFPYIMQQLTLHSLYIAKRITYNLASPHISLCNK
jgi:hypothetical protein